MVILRRRKGSVSNEKVRKQFQIRKIVKKVKVTLALMTELEKGEDSAREEGWISADEVEKSTGNKIKIIL